jgi:Fe2+ transport system protein FeoA
MDVASQSDCNCHGKRFRHHGPPVTTTGVPLASLHAGESGVVLDFIAAEECGDRMLALGLLPGKTVTVLNGAKRQPFLLRLGESRIVVDWRTLGQIYVAPVAGPRKGGRVGWWNV